LLDNFFENNQNKEDFSAILNNKNLSSDKKANHLEALGMERIAVPGLNSLASSLEGQISKLSKSNQDGKLTAVINAVTKLLDSVNQKISADKKKIVLLRQ
jgi:hypothetical protein